MKRTDGGFTLVELMIVLVIMGVLLRIAIPNFVALVRNYRIVGQANDLVISLALARSEAIRRGVPVVACRNPNAISGSYSCVSGSGTGGWEVGWMVFVDSNSSGTNAGQWNTGEQVLFVHDKLSGDNTLVGNGNNSNSVSYTPQGVAPSFFGAFTLTDPRGGTDGTRLICMASTGRTRVFSNGTTTCP